MSATQLQHVRVHGLGLTDDFLLQLSDRAQTARVEGATPASYDLPPRTSLEEAIQDAWDDARKAWLRSQQHGTDTWAGWVRPLLKALDYNFTGGGATGGKYAVNHLSETGDVPLHFTRQADLDRVTDETGLRVSPHGLMQGYLNATPQHLWGLVTNGETLRLLRDNAQVTRPAYVEFQIGEMLRTEDARAFRVLWLLLHRTRLRDGKTGALEKWNEASKELGQRANDTLRDGVQLAIEHLGTGFLARNPELLERTRSGEVTAQDLYRAALTTVYQMVFLFVTEDRDLLFARDEQGEYVPDAQTRARAAHYLTRALRQKAGALHGSATHTDAYAGWERLLGHLRTGFAPLGLPALGSMLFQPNLLSGLKLGNEAFYNAVRALSEISVNGSLRPVNYAGLDSEELGSIYESLLELVPRIEPGPRFSLTVLPGNERKSTGSYYTPSSLINLLLDSALNPVIDEAVRDKLPDDAMAALKGLKVIDPACGSGHFLIAAARRIGARLAELEEETSVPSPRALRKATRTVIAHCIYGADINPMAIELAKVALWLESQDAGKPLAFLDHRLRVGNSLLGVTPELMNAEDEIPEKITRGVTSRAVKAHTLHLPDDAFSVLEGDDKKTVSELKKRNKAEREALIRGAHGEQSLFDLSGDLAPLSAMVRALGQIEPDSAENVQAQESTYNAIRQDARLQKQKQLADAWCAAFVAPKIPGQYAITTATLHTLKRTPNAPALAPVKATVETIAAQYRFLHPHIEFPDVFGDEYKRGFDCVLGNPPWEALEANPDESFQRGIQSIQHYINNSGRFDKTSGGKNLYLYFSELSLNLIKLYGKVGLIAPTEIIQSKPAEKFADYIVKNNILELLVDIENRKIWFPAIHSNYRFSLIIMSRLGHSLPKFNFDVTDLNEIGHSETSFSIPYEILKAASPSRFSIPAFKISRDANIFLNVAARVRMMAHQGSEISGTLMFNFSPEDNLKKVESPGDRLPGYLNVYDGENLHQYDWRRKGLNSESQPFCTQYLMPVTHVEKRVASIFGSVPGWILALRRQARGNDSFVSISSFLPLAATEGSVSVIKSSGSLPLSVVTNANFNSHAFNYFISLRISGPNVNKGVYEQIPIVFTAENQIPSPIYSFIAPRVLELTFTASEISALALDMGYAGGPFAWNDERRFWLRAELDALYFILYGIDRADVEYIMETFPIVKRKDVAAHGIYRTKEAILSVFDDLTALGLERLREYRSRVPGGDVAGGWTP